MKLAGPFLCLFCIVLLPARLSAVDATKPASAQQSFAQKVRQVSLNMTLGELFDRLQRDSLVRIDVDWLTLSAAGLRPQSRVSIQADEASYGQLLSLALAQISPAGCPLAWYWDDDIVKITTQEKVLARGKRLSLAEPTISQSTGPSTLLPSGLSLRVEDGATTSPAGQAPSPVRGRINHVVFDNTPLADVIEYIRSISGANFFVNWEALKISGVTKETPVSLDLYNLSLSRLLDIVTEQLVPAGDRFQRVYWVADRGVVTISTGSSLDAQMRVHMLDVTDLILPEIRRSMNELGTSGVGASVFSGTGSAVGGSGSMIGQSGNTQSTGSAGMSTGTGLSFGGSSGTSGGTASGSASSDQQIENLIRIIKQTIGDDMWYPQGKGTIFVFNDRLVISQSLLGFKLLEESMRR
jgi:hypothetical protein